MAKRKTPLSATFSGQMMDGQYHLEASGLNLSSVVVEIHVTEHHHTGEEQRGGVGQVLACVYDDD